MLRRTPRLLLVAIVLAGTAGAAGCSKSRKDAISLINHGVRALNQDETTAAREAFRKAVEVDPDYAPGHYHLGLVQYHDLHDLDAARASFERALVLDPGDTDSLFQLARLLYDQDQAESATERLDALLSTRPEHSDGWYYRGRLAEDAGDRSSANDAYRKAAELDPHNAKAFHALGQLYERVGADREAMQVYREAVRLNREDTDNRLQLAALLMRYGRATEALDQLVTVEQLDPARHELLFSIGSALLAVGDDKRARYYLQRYTDPPQGEVATHLEVAQVLLGNIRKKEVLAGSEQAPAADEN